MLTIQWQTRCIARPLCDSRATCKLSRRLNYENLNTRDTFYHFALAHMLLVYGRALQSMKKRQNVSVVADLPPQYVPHRQVLFFLTFQHLSPTFSPFIPPPVLSQSHGNMTRDEVLRTASAKSALKRNPNLSTNEQCKSRLDSLTFVAKLCVGDRINNDLPVT